ncbi:MAG TPA: GIY-YIG nuclease family protein [Vicinamibacteria bacterium]|nr:GIY-YIG nuclease family protein [Vicinamibacteria bacterium]
MPWVYVLRCRDGSLYTGAAKDLGSRLKQHENGRASRYTRARLPVALVWSRRVRTWSKALREEWRLKRLTRTEKEALISGAARRVRVQG